MQKREIDVCMSPALYEFYAKDNTIVIMVDAIRASASICTAFINGISEIIPISEKSVALEYRKKGYLIAGERNGFKIEDFDFGNSPFNFTKEKIAGKKLAFTTTNGTRAINKVQEYKTENTEIFIGSFLNISALSKKIISDDRNVTILCSGWKNGVNIEDTVFAGFLTEKLFESGKFIKNEAANLAFKFSKGAKSNIYEFTMQNSPRLKQKRIVLEKDIRYCLQKNITDIVPRANKNGILVV